MKIVILDRATLGFDIDISIFNSFGEVISYDITFSNQIKDRIKDANILITNKVVISKDLMQNSSLELICVSATGTNNIDLEYAKTKNIKVKNVVDYSTSSVVQLSFAMILHFVQKLNYYKMYVDNGKWVKSAIFTHLDKPFYELDNKKIGIIGLGNIGLNLAKKLTAFDCEIMYYSTSGKNNNSDYKRVQLLELVENSDIISVHCPLNENTKNLLNYENLSKMKDGVILLNLGRGGIINELDLAKLLDEKEIYCGVDVVSKEPIEKTNPLLNVINKERLILTPHIAWSSIEARKRLILAVANNIETFMKNKQCKEL